MVVKSFNKYERVVPCPVIPGFFMLMAIPALLVLGMNQGLDELKLRSNSYGYSARLLFLPQGAQGGFHNAKIGSFRHIHRGWLIAPVQNSHPLSLPDDQHSAIPVTNP